MITDTMITVVLLMYPLNDNGNSKAIDVLL